MTVKKEGGADLFIVNASPPKADERSQMRLLRKIEAYLAFIGSTQFRSQVGSPSPENTSIVVKIHPNSDPMVFDLLQKSEPWILENHATLKVAKPNAHELGLH